MRSLLAIFRNANFLGSIGGGCAVVGLEAFYAGLPLLWKGVIVAGVFLLVSETVRIMNPKRQMKSDASEMTPEQLFELKKGREERLHALLRDGDFMGCIFAAGAGFLFFLFVMVLTFRGCFDLPGSRPDGGEQEPEQGLADHVQPAQ